MQFYMHNILTDDKYLLFSGQIDMTEFPSSKRLSDVKIIQSPALLSIRNLWCSLQIMDINTKKLNT